MKMNIPITKTIFGDEEKEAIVKPLETGWVVQGPNVAKFQNMFADFTGSKYAHATSNCTTALHLGLEAMGITKGDKVIVPSFTYVASANAVEYTGAEVVFCDIDLKTFNIDETKLEEIIKKDSSIKAIMPVNLFGLCANMPYIMKLAKKYNLKVIEDSACGFDGWIGDKHSGTFGDCGCFSFHPRKSICTGEGGMLITDDEDIASKVSQLKDHGASKSDLQRHKEKGGSLLPDFTMRGYNYRMTDMQGALGVCQMDRKEYIMNGRREVASKYDEVLKDISMEVEEGEVVAIIGPSGSGKTTALRCLAGLEPLDEGFVRYNGVCWNAPADKVHLAPRHRKIGFLAQHYGLFPHMTVEKNIRFAMRGPGQMEPYLSSMHIKQLSKKNAP